MRSVLPLLAIATLALVTDAAAFPQSTHPAMTDPSKATEKAPATFRAKFETTKGDVVFECTREWAPNGVDRFYNLVKIGFFDDVSLFRVAKDFVVQWGIHGDPKVSAAWREANLAPDPPKQSNKRGTLTYAMAGRPDTRSTQLFINYADNTNLDASGFAPICKVVQGMEVADAFYGGYGERVTSKQGEIQTQGNAYLKEKWPELDYIKAATIVGEAASAERSASPKAEASGNTGLYAIVAVIAAGLVAFVLTRKKEPEPQSKEKSGSKPSSGRTEPAREKGAPRKKKKRPKPD
jgi:peptidyl-prolyl cis-trans isomerase A (cyclophilin A)